MARRPRLTPIQRRVLMRIADGWQLTSDGVSTCWLDSAPGCPVKTSEEISMRTAERLILRDLLHPGGWLLPDGWAAIGRTPGEEVDG